MIGCDPCRAVCAINKEEPKCHDCRSKPPELLPVNAVPWDVWQTIHQHERAFLSGMSISPLRLSILKIAEFCGLYEFDKAVFDKIVLIERIMFNKIQLDYQNMQKPKGKQFQPPK